jgi:DNA-binding protein YbaB
MGAGMQSMPSSQEARLSQQNVHRLQAEFEESKFAGRWAGFVALQGEHTIRTPALISTLLRIKKF